MLLDCSLLLPTAQRRCSCLGSPLQDTARRGAADVETACDFGFAYAGAVQFTGLIGMQGGRDGAAQRSAVLPGMSQTGPHALDKSENFPARQPKVARDEPSASL